MQPKYAYYADYVGSQIGSVLVIMELNEIYSFELLNVTHTRTHTQTHSICDYYRFAISPCSASFVSYRKWYRFFVSWYRFNFQECKRSNGICILDQSLLFLLLFSHHHFWVFVFHFSFFVLLCDTIELWSERFRRKWNHTQTMGLDQISVCVCVWV